ncbi:MAG TPA: ribokinase [Steroidobacteraceae bacterium]|nr:ribokinase [Steroidobacteraceae bacterium]
MRRPSILVVGSANVDLVVAAEQLPRPGETILGHDFQTFCGGKGANQAVAAARAGGTVAMLGRVGTDAFGARLVGELAAAGVDTATIGQVDGPSGVALIVTAANGENHIVVAPGANSRLDGAAIDAVMAQLTHPGYVLAQLETPLEGVLRAAAQARAMGAVFVLDPAPAQPLPRELLGLTDWITPNEREACTLLGSDAPDPIAALQALRAMGPRNVILKMSSRGAYVLAHDGEPVHIPVVPVTAVDTTGAGDAFNGAFAVGLSEGRGAIEAARFAAAAAALSVTRPGAQPSMPMRAAIDALFRNGGPG